MYNQFARMQASQMGPQQSQKPQQQQIAATSSVSSVSQQLEKISLDDGDAVASLEQTEEHSKREPGNSEAKMRPQANDYQFEENNPFEGQFEDPFEEAQRRHQNRQYEEASLLYELAVRKDPRHRDAWFFLSLLLGQLNRQNCPRREMEIKATEMWMNLDKSAGICATRLYIVILLRRAARYREMCWHMLDWLLEHEIYRHEIGGSLEEYDQLSEGEFSERQLEYVKEKLLEAARMNPNNPDWEIQKFLSHLFEIAGDKEKAESCYRCALDVSKQRHLWHCRNVDSLKLRIDWLDVLARKRPKNRNK